MNNQMLFDEIQLLAEKSMSLDMFEKLMECLTYLRKQYE